MSTKIDAPADDIALPYILREGATLYVLNASGTNRWSAQVQPGRTDEDTRVSDEECESIAALIADRASRAGAVPAATREAVSMPQYWSVCVEVDGQTLVSIGFNWLLGSRPLERGDELAILGATQHLLSFVGYGLPPSSFDPDADEAAPQPEADTQGVAVPRSGQDDFDAWRQS